MHVVSTNISALYHSPLMVTDGGSAYFNCPLHSHPEFEIVYIAEGNGRRMIGKTLQDFQAGDMLLVGPNVAHCWVLDPAFHSGVSGKAPKAIVLYFNPDIFSPVFYDMEESHTLKRLYFQSQSGLVVEEPARQQILSTLKRLQASKNLHKMACLLEILQTLTTSVETQCIDQGAIIPQPAASHRLTGLFDFIHQNIDKNITLKQAAELVSLTPPSFSRFFKQRTGRTFIDYVQQTRISHASKILLETDFTVAEIAHKTGFNTVPNFNKLFRKITGSSPTAYRNSLKYTGQTLVS